MHLATLAGALLAIVTTWAVWSVALTGFGVLVLRWFGAARHAPGELATSFWLGYAAVLLLLQAWHLALPVTIYTTGLVLVCGLALAAAERRRLAAAFVTMGAPARLVAAGLATWVALRSLGDIQNYDTGVYHMPFVHWVGSYAIVPGLGNLHGRFGFNSASLLFAALLNTGPWAGRAVHVANGLLVAAFGCQAVTGGQRLLGSGPALPTDAWDVAALPGVLATCFGGAVSSLATDLPVFVLLLVATSRLFALLVAKDDDAAQRRAAHAVVLTMLAAAVTAKLSAAAFAGAAGLVSLVPLRGRVALRDWRGLTGRLALPALLVAVWLCRGAILSGYPLYPSRLLAVNVDWRVSAEQADAEAGWVRVGSETLGSNRLFTSRERERVWLRGVMTRTMLFGSVVMPLGALALALGLLLRERRRHGGLGEAARAGGWIAAALLAAGAVWWRAGPGPRFAEALTWSAAATVTAMLVMRRSTFAGTRALAPALAIALTATIAARYAIDAVTGHYPGGRGLAMRRAFLAVPGHDGWLATAPEPALLTYTTTSGLVLAMPAADDRCWNAELLCTPHPTAALRLRERGNLAAGFRLDGPWEPVRFPDPWSKFLPWWRCLREGGGPVTDAREVACRTRVEGGAAATPRP